MVSFFAFAISAQSMTNAGLPDQPNGKGNLRDNTDFCCSFTIRVINDTLPEPGGPVIVINVPGYSDSHLSTLFSASSRSFQAFSPIAPSCPAGLDEEEKKDKDDLNLDRISVP